MKAAIVTGANRGVGLGIVEILAKSLDASAWRVYLTSRNIAQGEVAVKQLHDKGLKNVVSRQLDVVDSGSINAFSSAVAADHPEGVNIIVNNAAVAYKLASTAPFAEQAKVTMRTNFTAVLELCRKMTPHLAKDARIVNLSGEYGRMALAKCRPDIQKRLMTPMSMPDVEALMAEFVQAAHDDKVEERGWVKSAYGLSKISVIKLSAALAQEFKNDTRRIVVNSCCPGCVITDLSGHKGNKTILEGADTPVYLAFLPPGTKEPNGRYVRDRVVFELEPVENII